MNSLVNTEHTGQPARLHECGTIARLVFDDEPLTPSLGGNEQAAPTPANVVELWDRDIDRSPSCTRAFIAVLARCPELLAQVQDLEAAEKCFRQTLETNAGNAVLSLSVSWGLLGHILERRKRPQEAEECYRKAIVATSNGDFGARANALAVANCLVVLLEKSGRNDEAHLLRARIRTNTLFDAGHANLDALRGEALSSFKGGRYEEAEAIYKHLLESGFEPASTRCHLARVLLMMDRLPEACEQVETVWAVRAECPSYVLVRVQILKVLLQMLAGEEWKAQLAQLKASFARSGAHMDWTMEPVLVHFRPRLVQEEAELLSALVAAACQGSKISELEANPLWRSACTE